jgi:glutathione S-transferase
MTTIVPLSWPELERLTDFDFDRIQGETNSQATLRLFGEPVETVRVTLYRDNHAWCPYCQKIWLWLEEKRIPYRIEKVSMFCYGDKEPWYKAKVPSGMLPALELNGRLITESDDILLALEREFGVLGESMVSAQSMTLRKLERLLFRAWCNWLCYPFTSAKDDLNRRSKFLEIVDIVEEALASTPGDYFLAEFSTIDAIFTPYVERMNASLYYYKGYSLREENPRFKKWFAAMETRSTYRGTQSDFHTHSHDLPPQMGGCYANDELQTKLNQKKVDRGNWFELPDVGYPEPENSRQEALHRVLKHRDKILRVNPLADEMMDVALRCALTTMMTAEVCLPPAGTDAGLRYLCDRVNVPCDMSIYAAKRLRTALEATAASIGNAQGEPIPTRHRRDRNPANFK